MPTYTYEFTRPDGSGSERFEIVQGMNDEPLSVHPETGVPVRRVITGGLGVMGKPLRRSTVVNKSLAAATPCGCSKTALTQTLRSPKRGPQLTSSACHSHGSRPHKH